MAGSVDRIDLGRCRGHVKQLDLTIESLTGKLERAAEESMRCGLCGDLHTEPVRRVCDACEDDHEKQLTLREADVTRLQMENIRLVKELELIVWAYDQEGTGAFATKADWLVHLAIAALAPAPGGAE